MDDNKYLQLSISAFITAIVIGLGWIFGELQPTDIDWIKAGLLGISILFGLYFLYKSKFHGSNTDEKDWVNNLVERFCEALPEIPVVLPLIMGIIIVTQNITKLETPDLSPITEKLSTNEQTLNKIATDIHNMPSCPTTEDFPTQVQTSTPVSCVTCCATPTPSDIYTSTPSKSPTQSPSSIETSTQTPTITSPLLPTSVEGCVITFGLNVRTKPGVTATPSNHAHIWLMNDACMTILYTSTPEWAHVQFEGFVRLKAGETVYVGTVTPTPTPEP